MPEERLHDELSLLHQMPSLSDIESSSATFVASGRKNSFGCSLEEDTRQKLVQNCVNVDLESGRTRHKCNRCGPEMQ